MAKSIIDFADGKIPVAPDESWKRYTIEAVMEKYLKGMGIKEDMDGQWRIKSEGLWEC